MAIPNPGIFFWGGSQIPNWDHYLVKKTLIFWTKKNETNTASRGLLWVDISNTKLSAR